MRKDTRLSLLFHIASDEKLGGAWGWGVLPNGVELLAYFTYTQQQRGRVFTLVRVFESFLWGGWLLYTPSIEFVVGWEISEIHFFVLCNLSITSCSHEKRYQALLAFSYCKWRKAGRGLGMGGTSKWRRVTGLLHLHSAAERQGVYFGKGIWVFLVSWNAAVVFRECFLIAVSKCVAHAVLVGP